MTELLIRLFVKDAHNTNNADVHSRYGKMAGVVGIVCNLILAGAKLLAGIISGSIAIIADAANNFFDATSSLVTLVGFRLGEKPADKQHPFGHARYEYIAGLGVAVLVLVVGIELGQSSISKILEPSVASYSTAVLVVLVASIVAKVWLAVFNLKIAKSINSVTLRATFVDARNDVIITTVLLASALVSRYTSLMLDGWMGAAVAVFILISGVRLVKETLDPLLGQGPSSELEQYILAKIKSYSGILDTHDLIVHDYGHGRRYASAHVEMDSQGDALQDHEIIDTIERDFSQQDNINLLLHYDPVLTGTAAAESPKGMVEKRLHTLDARLKVHDFKALEQADGVVYMFDVVLPQDTQYNKEQLEKELEAALKDKEMPVRVQITVDDSFAAMPN